MDACSRFRLMAQGQGSSLEWYFERQCMTVELSGCFMSQSTIFMWRHIQQNYMMVIRRTKDQVWLTIGLPRLTNWHFIWVRPGTITARSAFRSGLPWRTPSLRKWDSTNNSKTKSRPSNPPLNIIAHAGVNFIYDTHGDTEDLFF